MNNSCWKVFWKSEGLNGQENVKKGKKREKTDVLLNISVRRNVLKEFVESKQANLKHLH